MTAFASPPLPTLDELRAAWAALPLSASLVEHAHRRFGELWPLVARCVRINSFTGNHAGCDLVLDELGAALTLPGLALRRVPGEGAACHGVWTSEAWGTRAGALLVGHHDTVFPPGTFERYDFDERFVYGPGVLDMKGGLAIVRTALAALSDAGMLASLPLALVSVSDEETGSSDGRRVIEPLCERAAFGLVFEAGRTTDAIVVRRKGTGKLVITAHGRAAHAGNDLAAGRNAIWALAQVIDEAQRQSRADGSVTINVGLVSGGTSANTVPAQARCEIDLRASSAAEGERALAALAALAARVTETTEVTFSFEGGLRRRPLEATAASLALAARYGAFARAVGLAAEAAPLVGGGSDANTLGARDVPVIDGLGPRGRAFHTPEEHAEIATFAPRLGALLATLVALADPDARA